MGGIVYFIGAGPGDPDLLTLKGRQIVDSADVIVHAGFLENPALLDGARSDAAVHDSSVLNLRQVTDIMIAAARRGKIVARLHAGGSFLYGAVAEQLVILREAGVVYSVVPGVSLDFTNVPSRLCGSDSSHASQGRAGCRSEGNPVITTEHDGMGFPAVDMLIRHLTGAPMPGDPDLLKSFQAAILDGDPVGFYPRDLETAHNMQGHAHLYFYDSVDALIAGGCAAGLIVSPQQVVLPGRCDGFVLVHPRNLTVGIDCQPGTTSEEIEKGVRNVFAEHTLSMQSIAAICTVDHKRNEDGLIEFAVNKGVPLEFFSEVDINKIGIVPSEPEIVSEGLGVQRVAEQAALLGSSGGGLLIAEVIFECMTIAVAARPIRQILQDSGVC